MSESRFMTASIDETFATRWAEAWNRRDLEAVLEYFNEDIVFTSPTALAVTGAATVHGKEALREYWKKALSRVSSLQFQIERVLRDLEQNELAIIYISRINGKARKVSENFVFNDDGLVVRGEVFHGP